MPLQRVVKGFGDTAQEKEAQDFITSLLDPEDQTPVKSQRWGLFHAVPISEFATVFLCRNVSQERAEDLQVLQG